MEDIFFNIFGYTFRKLGLFSRYIFYLLIGKKKTLKQLDRIQRDPVNFTQRGINTFLGFVEVIIFIVLLAYIS